MATEGNNPSSARLERDLIEAAFVQASPRESGVSFIDDLPSSETFPGYEIIREVHRGGQGAVYLAIQKATKRRVAIKVMHGGPFQGSSGRARFEREVQVLGQLNHPNIVRIHDSGVTTDGSCFYVMDYISGRSLDEVITESKKAPVDETLRLFGKICEAVNAAHLRGVIHRDLKPANVRINASGEPVIVDFGLAKTAVPDVTADSHPRLMTMTGQFIGSLPWASPEQAEGLPDKIDVRTDVYSLGVILYQLLTGKFPYDVAGNMRDVLDNILRKEPARPSTVRRQINDEVETIVLKCLSKDRERRYQSAGELGRDIRHYLSGEPIEAKRDSGWYLISKAIRRHRFSAAFAAVVLTLIVGFSIAMSIAWAAEARERKRADANFEIIRDQARTFMYDFNQSIANLRGGTKARELLFQKAKESLGRLRDQAGNDANNVGLRREIADASDLLGDIRNGVYSPKVGGAGSAKDNYQESRTIRETILKERPSEFRSHADMAESHNRSAQTLMDELKFQEAAQEAANGVVEYDTALQLAANEPAATLKRLGDGRANLVMVEGDAWGSLADPPRQGVDPDGAAVKALDFYKEAAAYWLQRVNADPGDLKAIRRLGVARDNQAMITTTRGVILARLAKPLAKTDAAKAVELTSQADTRFGEGRALAEDALADFQRFSQQHVENAEWRRDCYLALYTIGMTHMLSGDAFNELGDGSSQLRARQEWAQSAAFFQQAQAIVDDLAGSDQSNLQARRDQVIVLNKRGNMLRKAGALSDAEAVFKRSLDVRRDLNQTDQTPQTQRDLAVGYYKVGQVRDLQADAESAPARKRDLLQQAIDDYGRAFTEFDGLRDASGRPAEQESAKEASLALAKCREKLGKIPPQ